MDTGFLHLHVTVDILFLIWYGLKVFLLLTNVNRLQDLRDKYKWVDMVLGALILITGGYLLYKAGHPETWLMVKVGMVLVLIPLGIIALRRLNKVLAVGVFVGFLYIYGVSETRSLTFSKPKVESAVAMYTQNCVRCHGDNGAAMKYGALNLQTSVLAKDQVKYTIVNGRGSMPKLEGDYSEAQIDALADYVISLRK
jgi:uncharacterized membrane protein SirB2